MNMATFVERPDPSLRSPLVTIFSAPKPSQGHVGITQENAIRSWSLLRPRPKIILFSNDSDTLELGRRLEVDMVRNVETNPQGTPLVSNMFAQASALAADTVLAFVNSDIILTQNTIEAAGIAVQWSKRFLMVAQRHDVDVRSRLAFDPGWDPRWVDESVARGKLHPPGAIDWFVFPRGQYEDMPPFAIGRTAYDNWLLWKTVAMGVPLVDATAFVKLIHQNHDYQHSKLDTWLGPEAQQNRKWIEHWTHYYTIAHANWMLTADGRVEPARGWKYRLAGPRQLASHILRASRPIRTRIRSWRFARRYGV